MSNKSGWWVKFLWPSQNTWTFVFLLMIQSQFKPLKQHWFWLFRCVLSTFFILGSLLTIVSQFYHNWYLQLQNDSFFATKVKFFWQLSGWFSVFCDIEFLSSFASVYEPILGSFLLTTNLATTGWTRKWRQQKKTPKWNKTNLQTTTETMEWTNYTKTAQ